MKVLVFLAVWKRPEITEICFMGLSRLRKNSRLALEAFAVISEESMIPLCEKYGIKYTFYKNEPLGEKKNHGLNEAMKLEWDYLIEIGSDDLLKDELLLKYEPLMGKHDYFGTKDSVIINSVDGHCRRLQSDTVYGLGRCISREALNVCYGVDILAKEHIIQRGRTTAQGEKGFFKLDSAKQMESIGMVEIIGEPRYRLWKDDLMMGLDNNSGFFLMTQGIGHHPVETDQPLTIDIKSAVNIWAFGYDLGEPYSLSEALEGLSKEEINAIQAVIESNKVYA